MPHVSDVRPTSHDRHDALLVAALAIGDLAGTDRDQASAIIRSCTDCAALHDDLVAIARATAVAPPPFSMPARDFRLTSADVARLRPSGWGRVVAAFRAAPRSVSRPLGVGLATLGLAGLLVGNVQLDAPSAQELPAAAGSGAVGQAAAPGDTKALVEAAASAPAASSMVDGGTVPAGSAAASTVPLAPAAGGSQRSSASNDFGAISGGPVSTGGVAAASAGTVRDSSGGTVTGTAGAASVTLLTALSIAAIVVGLVVLVAGTFRGRRPA